MASPITIDLNTNVIIAGDSPWTTEGRPDTIVLGRVTIVNVNEDDEDEDEDECTQLSVTVEFNNWDTAKHGLLYLDSCIEDIQSQINEHLDRPVTIDWSEEGMQGEDYLHFDGEYV